MPSKTRSKGGVDVDGGGEAGAPSSEVPKMAAMAAETEDERQSLIGSISRKAYLYKTQRTSRIRQRIANWIVTGMSPDEEHGGRPYSVVSDCCALSVNIQNEIITRYYSPVRHNLHGFFPEIDSLVVDPTDYLRLAKRILIGMEDMNGPFSQGSLLDLQRQGFLPPYAVTAIDAFRSSLPACSTILSRETIIKMGAACHHGFLLEFMREDLDAFVYMGGRIGLLAPNLSALVGAVVAAKLIGAAGGLWELSTRPIPDIPLLSPVNCGKEESSATCSKLFDYPQQEQPQTQLPHDITRCYVAQTSLVRSTPKPQLQSKACHILADRIHLAATIDLNRTDPAGEKGRAMGEEIRVMIEKWKDEDSAMLMKLRTELTDRPKKKRLAVSNAYSKMFKPNLSIDKSRDTTRCKRGSEWAERVLSSLKEFGLTPTTATPSATLASNLRAH